MLNLDYLESKDTTAVLSEMNEYDVVDASQEFIEAYMTDYSSEWDRMFWMYLDADAHEKAVIDAVFMHICGYTYHTLVEHHLGMSQVS